MTKQIDPTLRIYDSHASTYDKRTAMMETFFQSKVNKMFKILKGKILEVGVGTGNNLKNYNETSRVTALDWSPRMILYAKLKAKRLNLSNIDNFIVGDIQKLEDYFEQSYFDFVVSRCVFCSVPDPIKGLKQVAKVLKSSGKFIQVEHGISNFKPINLFLKAIDPIAYRVEGVHIKRDHIKNLDQAGFKLLKHTSLDPTSIFRLMISQKIY